MIGTQIQQIEENQLLLKESEQFRVDRFAALIKSIAFQIGKESGYDNPEDPRALQKAQKIATQRA